MAMSVTYTTINGQIVYENRNGVQRHYVPDTLGSTIALMDSTGTITDTYTYWPFGEIRNHTGPSVTPFTYGGTIGYYLQILNNFIYIRARYLRQKLARWQTTDPFWPKSPAYIFASSAPILFVDPDGRQVIRMPRNIGKSTSNYGPCVVYECTEHTMNWPGFGWAPTHKYVCVSGPNGGCAGGIGPAGGISAQPTNTFASCPAGDP